MKSQSDNLFEKIFGCSEIKGSQHDPLLEEIFGYPKNRETNDGLVDVLGFGKKSGKTPEDPFAGLF